MKIYFKGKTREGKGGRGREEAQKGDLQKTITGIAYHHNFNLRRSSSDFVEHIIVTCGAIEIR